MDADASNNIFMDVLLSSPCACKRSKYFKNVEGLF